MNLNLTSLSQKKEEEIIESEDDVQAISEVQEFLT